MKNNHCPVAYSTYIWFEHRTKLGISIIWSRQQCNIWCILEWLSYNNCMRACHSKADILINEIQQRVTLLQTSGWIVVGRRTWLVQNHWKSNIIPCKCKTFFHFFAPRVLLYSITSMHFRTSELSVIRLTPVISMLLLLVRLTKFQFFHYKHKLPHISLFQLVPWNVFRCLTVSNVSLLPGIYFLHAIDRIDYKFRNMSLCNLK